MADTVKARVENEYQDVSLSELRQSFELPADLFTGRCSCRPILVGGILIIGGEDNCPVHGFATE